MLGFTRSTRWLAAGSGIGVATIVLVAFVFAKSCSNIGVLRGDVAITGTLSDDSLDAVLDNLRAVRDGFAGASVEDVRFVTSVHRRFDDEATRIRVLRSSIHALFQDPETVRGEKRAVIEQFVEEIIAEHWENHAVCGVAFSLATVYGMRDRPDISRYRSMALQSDKIQHQVKLFIGGRTGD